MKYPVAVWSANGEYSASVPDLPGAITQADSLEKLEANVKEAAALWMEGELDEGRSIPKPSSFENFAADRDYDDCIWMLIDIDPDTLSDKTERVNICFPARVLRRLDFLASSAGASRSGYLSQLVINQATA